MGSTNTLPPLLSFNLGQIWRFGRILDTPLIPIPPIPVFYFFGVFGGMNVEIASESANKWLIRKVGQNDDFSLTAKIIKEEEKEKEGDKYTILHLEDANGTYKVSSWSLLTENGIHCTTKVGEFVQVYAKKGNNTKFFIKNVEEDIKK